MSQAMFLVDTAQGAVIAIHCSVKWPNGTNVVPQVALRNAGDLLTFAADKDYDDMSFREDLRAEGVCPLIRHCVFAPLRLRAQRWLDDELYHQRSIYETVNSAIRARTWYRQFREVALTAAVTSNRLSNDESCRSLRIQ